MEDKLFILWQLFHIFQKKHFHQCWLFGVFKLIYFLLQEEKRHVGLWAAAIFVPSPVPNLGELLLSKTFLTFISSLLLCLWVKKKNKKHFNCLHTFHLKFLTLSRCLICRLCPGAKTARLTKSASTMINRLFSKLFQAAYL